MVYPISNREILRSLSPDLRKFFIILSGIVAVIVSLTIFQDFLESKRSGYHFHFGESLLFKTVWFLYLPIGMFLYQKLKNETLNSHTKTALFILVPATAHLLILPCIAGFFALLFFNGQYDLFKFFSYTLTHDLYLLFIAYTGIVLVYKYLLPSKKEESISSENLKTDTIIITNGKHNEIIYTKDILQISSATPYVSIHLDDKKYLHSETLKSMLSQLDTHQFIRVHKSTVVNLSKVRLFRSRLNGDYDLEMTNHSIVRLSRTYAVDFKRRFHQNSSG